MVSYWKLAVLVVAGILLWFGVENVYSDRAAHFLLLVYVLLGIKFYQWLGHLSAYLTRSSSA